MSRTPSPTSVPPNLNDSFDDEDEVFFGQPTEDEERARALCEEFEMAMRLQGEAAPLQMEDEEEQEENQLDLTQTQEEAESLSQSQSQHQPAPLAPASNAKRDISNDDTIEEIDLMAAPLPTAAAAAAVTAVVQTPPRIARPTSLLRPLLGQGLAPASAANSLLLPPPPAFVEVHSPLLSAPLPMEQPQMQLEHQQQLNSEDVRLDPIVIEAASPEPDVKEETAPVVELTTEITAEVETTTELTSGNGSGNSLSQVRATLLKLKQNRSGVGSSRVPRLQPHIPSAASKMPSPSATATGTGIPTLHTRIPVGRPPVTLGNSSSVLASVPSTKPPVQAVPAPSALPAPAQTAAAAAPTRPAVMAAPTQSVPAAAVATVVPLPVPAAAVAAPTRVPTPVVPTPTPSPPIPSISDLLARSVLLSSAAPIPPSSTLAALSSLAPAQKQPPPPQQQPQPQQQQSKLSTLASTKQLASPAPAKKSMSVFARTASLQAQVAALQRTSIHQHQQQQQMALTQPPPPPPASSAQAPQKSLSLTRPASASTGALVAALLTRPLSAPSPALASAPAPASTPTPASARRGVLWRDEDQGVDLEDVRFMSPPVTPEKEAGGGDSSHGLLSATSLLFKAKPLPDLTKTPTKSCLRRNAPLPAIGALPAHVAHLSALKPQNENALENGGGQQGLFASAAATAAPLRTHSQPSAVQSGARRVPNLAQKPALMGSSLSGALRTVQPLAAPAPSSHAFATDKPHLGTAAFLQKRHATSTGLLR